MLSEQLEKNYDFTMEEAENATKSFLQSFRSCPDNGQTTLDSWRSYLWTEALPSNFKHLAEPIYRHWLQLRYRYLAIPQEYQDLLQNFRSSGYRLALITNGPSNAQWEKVQKLHVSQYFDCVLVSSDLPWEKPHPNIFLTACDFLNVKPYECVMIGDKIETDIQGAKAAKLGGSIWIPLNQEKLLRFEDDHHDNCDVLPDLIVHNLCEIYKFFPKMTRAPGNSGSGLGSSSSSHVRRNSSQHAARNNPTTSRGYHQYRRGISLPEIDSCSSENSSDSVFS